MSSVCWVGYSFSGVEAAPVVIWASDPVRPGETVVVRGDAFGKKAKVEVSVSGKGGWKQAEVLQQTETDLEVCFADRNSSGCGFLSDSGGWSIFRSAKAEYTTNLVDSG